MRREPRVADLSPRWRYSVGVPARDRRVNRFLTAKLREYALRLRGMAGKGAVEADLHKAKADMMAEVYKVRYGGGLTPGVVGACVCRCVFGVCGRRAVCACCCHGDNSLFEVVTYAHKLYAQQHYWVRTGWK